MKKSFQRIIPGFAIAAAIFFSACDNGNSNSLSPITPESSADNPSLSSTVPTSSTVPASQVGPEVSSSSGAIQPTSSVTIPGSSASNDGYQAGTLEEEIAKDAAFVEASSANGELIPVVDLLASLKPTDRVIFVLRHARRGSGTGRETQLHDTGKDQSASLGAAIATVIGQIASMILALLILFLKKHEVHISFKNVKFSLATVKNIYAVGIPSIIMQSITSVMLMLVNIILKKFSNSDVAISVLNVYFKLQSFVFMPCFGLNQGLLPIMGFNYGAKNKERLITTIKYGISIALCIMTLGTVTFLSVPELLLGMFNADSQMMDIGRVALRTICVCFIPAAVGIIFISFFQATGHGLRSMLISLLRQLIVLVPSAFFLSFISLDAVWFAFPIAEAMALLFAILLFSDLYNKEIKHLGKPAA